MKKIITLTLAMVFMSSLAWAETFKFIEESKEKAPAIERKIVIEKAKEYLEITVYPKDSKPIVYRIWPCGLVQRMEWKDISPNLEANYSTFTTTTNPIYYSLGNVLQIR